MTDTAQKIAEIREAAEEARKTDRSWVDGQDYADDVEFLLDELEKITEQIDELLDEKAEWQVVADRGWHVAGEETKKNESLSDQLQSAQQEIERLGNLARELEAAKNGAEE